MPDCFISYCSEDERLARFVEAQLRSQGVSVFMASVSLRPGQNWSQETWNNLRASSWRTPSRTSRSSRRRARTRWVQMRAHALPAAADARRYAFETRGEAQ